MPYYSLLCTRVIEFVANWLCGSPCVCVCVVVDHWFSWLVYSPNLVPENMYGHPCIMAIQNTKVHY